VDEGAEVVVEEVGGEELELEIEEDGVRELLLEEVVEVE